METINAADWGVLPGDDVSLAARLGALLSTLRERPGVRLRMEPGIYHFYPQGLPLHRWNISNHDACGGQAAGLLLEGFRDFTLDGGGSRWVFHAQMLPCRVAHSSGVRLENFSLDLARPVYSEGVIREVRPQQMTVWIDPEKYPWNVENGRLVFTGENFRRAMHLWLEMDAKTRAPAWGTEDLYFCTETQKVGLHPAIKAAAGDLVQITLKGGEHFFAGSRAGNRLVFRHHPRTAPAVYAADSKDICCENIRVHHAAGMGFLAERCENVTLKRFDVTPSPGTGRCFSAAADAAHFVNCGGKVALEGCRFEKQMDDGLNVRSAASTDSDVLGLAENGDTFLLLVGEAKDGWYQIQYEGKTAYVSEDYVTVKEVSVEEAAKLRGEGGSSESSSEGSSSEESSDAPDSKAPESSATTAPGVSRDSEDGEA